MLSLSTYTSTRRHNLGLVLLLGAVAGCSEAIGPEPGVTAEYLVGFWQGSEFWLYDRGIGLDHLSWVTLTIAADGQFTLSAFPYNHEEQHPDTISVDGTLTLIDDFLVRMSTLPDSSGFWETAKMSVADPLSFEAFRDVETWEYNDSLGGCRLETADVLRLAALEGQAFYDVDEDGVRDSVQLAWKFARVVYSEPCVDRNY